MRNHRCLKTGKMKTSHRYQTLFPCTPEKARAVGVQTSNCLKDPSVTTLVWNDDNVKRKGRKTPLLLTSHITHYISPNSHHPQIPSNCPLFLRTTLRAGFGQNCSRTASCAPVFSGAPTLPSLPSQLQGCSMLPRSPAHRWPQRCPGAALVRVWWGNTVMQVPLLARLNLPWTGIVTPPQRRSLQALEKWY